MGKVKTTLRRNISQLIDYLRELEWAGLVEAMTDDAGHKLYRWSESTRKAYRTGRKY